MYSKILFAVDHDEALAAAVPVVAAYARKWGAAVRVLHIHQIDPPRPTAPAGSWSRAATAEAPLDHSAANGIVAAAERHGADLVVLGSRRPTQVGGLLLGSVAHEAIHQLRCPVLMAYRVREVESVG